MGKNAEGNGSQHSDGNPCYRDHKHAPSDARIWRIQPVFPKCGSDRAGNPHCAGNLSLLFYICISGGFFRSAAGNGKNNGADGGYPCKYVRNPYAESLVPDAALSQRGRGGRNLSDHLDDYGCLPGRDVLAAEQKMETGNWLKSLKSGRKVCEIYKNFSSTFFEKNLAIPQNFMYNCNCCDIDSYEA